MSEPLSHDHGAPAGKLVWRRAHVLSPLMNAWLLIAVFLFTIGRDIFEDVFTSDASFPDLSQVPDLPDFLQFVELFGRLWLLALLALVFSVLLLPYYVGWWFYRFAVDAQNVYIRSGIFTKNERKARLERVQSIDINRSLLARLLGLAELKFDVADGAETAFSVKFLSYRDARDLRDALLLQVQVLQGENVTPPTCSETSPLADASGHEREKPGQGFSAESPRRLQQHLAENLGPGVQEAGEVPLIHVPVTRLLLSMALSVSTIFSVLLVFGLALFILFTGGDLVSAFAANIACIFALVSALWKRFNTGFNFRLSRSPNGLKTRYGFTDAIAQTVPLGRVQSMTVEQPLLWRIPGWYRVKVALAGKSGGEETYTGYLLPVGTYEELLKVLPLVVPGASEGGADASSLRAGLIGCGASGGFTVSPQRARLVDPLSYLRNGFALLPALLLRRSGRLTRRLAIVPHAKIQNLTLTQGLLARSCGLAHLLVHTAGGASARLSNMDAEVARALFIRQAQLAVQEQASFTSSFSKVSGCESALDD